jgi:hypothetical protein
MSGSFSLAIGYAEIFWPELVEYKGFVLRKGFSDEGLKGFAKQGGATRGSVECVMNHIHIASLQHEGCEDISRDKLVALGRVLKEIYQAKLLVQFPERPCAVELFEPEDQEDWLGLQLSFWQLGGEEVPANG